MTYAQGRPVCNRHNWSLFQKLIRSLCTDVLVNTTIRWGERSIIGKTHCGIKAKLFPKLNTIDISLVQPKIRPNPDSFFKNGPNSEHCQLLTLPSPRCWDTQEEFTWVIILLLLNSILSAVKLLSDCQKSEKVYSRPYRVVSQIWNKHEIIQMITNYITIR